MEGPHGIAVAICEALGIEWKGQHIAKMSLILDGSDDSAMLHIERYVDECQTEELATCLTQYRIVGKE